MANAELAVAPAAARDVEPETPSDLLPNDHYILHKLHDEVLPWLVAGGRIRRRWFVVLSIVWAYLGDASAALAGFGLGTPLIKAITEVAKGGTDIAQAAAATLPPGWRWAGVAGALLWATIRLVNQREDVTKRAVIAREFVLVIRELNTQLHRVLTGPTPLPEIAVIQKRLATKVDEAMHARVWEWEPFPKDAKFQREVAERTAEIRKSNMANWNALPRQERRNG